MTSSSIIFSVLFITAISFFIYQIKKIKKNIHLGKGTFPRDNPKERWINTITIALGQSKMTKRPTAAVLHLLVYLGFIIINVEVLEIVIDGLLGTHRILSFTGNFYHFIIGSFEILAFGVLIACTIFLIQRNILKLKRLNSSELKGFSKTDANLILLTEIILMIAFLSINASEGLLQKQNIAPYLVKFAQPISGFIEPLFSQFNTAQLITIERSAWWIHIIGIFAFLNYLPYSKHLHIILAFPNVYFSKLGAKGALNNLVNVSNEVKLMLNPNAVIDTANTAADNHFGAKDVFELSKTQLLNAYSCTECGRCSSVCPANITGKKLSPRKIMMDTRDRLQEVGKNINQNKTFISDNKSLLHDYISAEELLACTTCNACTEACPINIDPLSIIIDLRRHLIMEESNMPGQWANMLTNIENNAAPWQFSQADRANWRQEN